MRRLAATFDPSDARPPLPRPTLTALTFTALVLSALTLTALALTALALTAAPAAAQITNGNFESAGNGWTVSAPNDWLVTFPITGGNPDGHARIDAPPNASAGQACIRQTFNCGQPGMPGECRMAVDLAPIDTTPDLKGAGPGTGPRDSPGAGPRELPYPGTRDTTRIGVEARILVLVDGDIVHSSLEFTGFKHVTFQVPCGEHELALCLEAPAGNPGRAAVFDNVTASCEPPTPIDRTSWGRIKGRWNRAE